MVTTETALMAHPLRDCLLPSLFTNNVGSPWELVLPSRPQIWKTIIIIMVAKTALQLQLQANLPRSKKKSGVL